MSTTIAASTSDRKPLAGFATVAAVVISSLLLTNWPIYSEMVLGGRIPLHYYAMCFLLAGFVCLGWLLFDIRRIDGLLGEPLVLWFVIYVVVGYAWLQFSAGDPEMLASHWRMRILAFLFFLTGWVIGAEAHRKWIGRSILCTFAFAVALNWFDLLNPGQLVPFGIEGSNPGRGAGLFINANISAAFVMMASVALVPYLPMRLRGLMFSAMIVGVIPTISRFGIVFAIPLVILAIWLRLLDRRQSILLVLMAATACGVLALFYGILLAIPSIDVNNVVGRLEWFSSIGREVDDSADERLYIALLALRMFVDNPVFGAGLAATYRAYEVSSHNIYLVFAAEQGLPGLVLYLSFIYLVVLRGVRSIRLANLHGWPADQGSALLIFILLTGAYGVFSHNVLDHPFLLLLLGFLVTEARNRFGFRDQIRR